MHPLKKSTGWRVSQNQGKCLRSHSGHSTTGDYSGGQKCGVGDCSKCKIRRYLWSHFANCRSESYWRLSIFVSPLVPITSLWEFSYGLASPSYSSKSCRYMQFSLSFQTYIFINWAQFIIFQLFVTNFVVGKNEWSAWYLVVILVWWWISTFLTLSWWFSTVSTLFIVTLCSFWAEAAALSFIILPMLTVCLWCAIWGDLAVYKTFNSGEGEGLKSK